jgi:hypothetical protein
MTTDSDPLLSLGSGAMVMSFVVSRPFAFVDEPRGFDRVRARVVGFCNGGFGALDGGAGTRGVAGFFSGGIDGFKPRLGKR